MKSKFSLAFTLPQNLKKKKKKVSFSFFVNYGGRKKCNERREENKIISSHGKSINYLYLIHFHNMPSSLNMHVNFKFRMNCNNNEQTCFVSTKIK